MKVRCLLLPDSKVRTFIDIITFALILMVSLYIPYLFAFDIDTSSLNYEIIELMVDIWFLVEMIFNFFTAFYHKGQLVFKRKLIIINYINLFIIGKHSS